MLANHDAEAFRSKILDHDWEQFFSRRPRGTEEVEILGTTIHDRLRYQSGPAGKREVKITDRASDYRGHEKMLWGQHAKSSWRCSRIQAAQATRT